MRGCDWKMITIPQLQLSLTLMTRARSWCVDGALLDATSWPYRAYARATGAADEDGNW